MALMIAAHNKSLLQTVTLTQIPTRVQLSTVVLNYTLLPNGLLSVQAVPYHITSVSSAATQVLDMTFTPLEVAQAIPQTRAEAIQAQINNTETSGESSAVTLSSPNFFDAQGVIRRTVTGNSALESAGWAQGQTANTWNWVSKSLGEAVVGAAPGTVTHFVLPYDILQNQIDLKETLKILSAVANARGIQFSLIFMHEGFVSDSEKERVLKLAQPNILIGFVAKNPSAKSLSQVLTFIKEIQKLEFDKVNQLVFGENLSVIQNNPETLGLEGAQQILGKGRVHVFGIEETKSNQQAYSGARLALAGLVTIFDNLGIPIKANLRMVKISTPLGDLYVAVPVELNEALRTVLLAKQAEIAA